MPPTPDMLHEDAILTNLSIMYKNEMFIADEVLPVVPVTKRSDKYFVYDKKDTYRLIPTEVGPKAQPNEVDWNVGTQNYSVVDHALADYVSIEEIGNADNPLRPRSDTNDQLNEWLSLAREYRVAQLIFNGGTYSADQKRTLAANVQWGQDAATPIKDVQAAVEGCFVRANTLVFGRDAWLIFRQLPEVLDAVKSSTRHDDTPGGLATKMEIAKLFEVDKVLVGRARYNSARPGKAANYEFLWGKKMAALHVVPGAGIKTITFGKSFMQRTRHTQTSLDAKRGAEGAEYMKVGYNCDEKIVAPDLGLLLDQVVG